MSARNYRFLLAALSLWISHEAKADILYDSITQAIESVEAQAYVYLERGKYAFDNGRSRIVWTIPRDIRSTISFRYAEGTIQKGLIDFQRAGTSFLIRTPELCSKVMVKKIAVLPGGAIDEAESDYTLDPASPECREPRSQLEAALEGVVSLQIDPAKTFAGKVFAGSEALRKCPTDLCDGPVARMPLGQPVTKFVAFSTDGPDSKKAFAVSLRTGSSLLFPNNAGYVKLSNGSGVQIQQATYDLGLKSGSGVMKKLLIAADEGNLNFGSAILSPTVGSKIAFEDVAIAQEADVTTVTRGSFSGTLGGNSFITLNSNGPRKSLISVAQASVTIAELNMEFRGSKATISGASGDFKLLAEFGGSLSVR
ncbi:hypothetical protein [Bradyrhizobium japonicum]|uniref:hypothetical protein n=1 Tax=Bradyrhizobium japonicum TaxID=375 RepID=UPI001BA6B31F|nr:hypothetical protein [Bradyrhizobium japonicum]MBR0958370.1 hypothetical protein [Bradyrhizobium japonicum]